MARVKSVDTECVVEAPMERVWGILSDVNSRLSLEPLDDGKRVRVRHGERVEGPLAAVIPTAVAPIWRAGLGNINKGLKAYAERGRRR